MQEESILQKKIQIMTDPKQFLINRISKLRKRKGIRVCDLNKPGIRLDISLYMFCMPYFKKRISTKKIADIIVNA